MLKGLYKLCLKGAARGGGAWSAPPGEAGKHLVQNELRGKQLFPPRHVYGYRDFFRRSILACIFLLYLGPIDAIAAPPGAVISNQASVDFLNVGGGLQTFDSNIVDVVTGVLPSASSLEFTRVAGTGSGLYQETVGPSACFQGGSFVTLVDPTLVGGAVIDPTQLQDVSVTGNYNLGEPAFIRLTDPDQNLDYLVVEYAVVTISSPAGGDSETIQLTETGPDTGVFAGYVPTASGAAVPGDCVLQGSTNSVLRVDYADPADGADTSNAVAALDPVNVVFESRTGTVVSGALIELVESVSGAPATVYGNDGLSTFPSSITSGATETDSSGATYVFGPGEYRFPVVPDGNYRLVVTPPTDYVAPSTTSISDLQNLPGAPYALGPGSFGSDFAKSGNLSFDVDLPVDPSATALFMKKSTLTTIAAPGDFVRYELVVENTSSTGFATDVVIIDELPPGVRFIAGSVTRDGSTVADPIVDMTNGTLTFDVGDLATAEVVQLFYVVEIISGERNQELVNTAIAYADNGLISNQSDARIRLTEDLFRSTSTLIGRVIEGDCNDGTFAEERGIENVRIYLEDGRYAVSDEGGRFHFEGLNPGNHLAQMDLESVANYFDVIGCDTASAYGGRADSQLVRLTRGSLTRANFYLRRKAAPEGQVDIELENVETDSTEEVGYVLSVKGNGKVGISNISLMVMLPQGVSYKPNSMTVDGSSVGEPRVAGPSLIISLPDQSGDWTSEVAFTASIDAGVDGELTTQAFAKFDSPIAPAQQTPIVATKMERGPAVVENAGYVLNLNFDIMSAELSTADQLELGILIEDWEGVSDINIQVVGHSDSTKISANNRHLFADNYVLSEARASAAAGFVALALNIESQNIQIVGRGPDDPIASNATIDGRQQNRRVEMILSGVRPMKPSFLAVTQASSGTRFAETKGAVPGKEEARLAKEMRERKQLEWENYARQSEPEIGTLRPGIEMILPAEGHLPPLPVTRVSVKHDVDQSVTVYLNDRPITALNYDGMATSADQSFAISRWAGVDLKDGSNVIRAQVRNADGSVADTISRTINYTGAPIRGEIVKDMSILVADGRTRPVIAVRLFDRTGQKTRKGTAGEYGVSKPYRSWWEVEDGRKNQIVEIGNRRPLYRVEDDGIALIELAPTTHSGEAVLILDFENHRQQEIRVWLSAEQRDWILVGFAEGTLGYNTLEDNQSAALAAGHDDGYYNEGRVAFFAKGSIKGEYLLTLAYDSARDRDESRSQFQTVVDPNAYYALYGDKSEQRFEAASQRKLYVKLEKQQFYALFGDFNTGLSYTDLARYERRMNGFLSEYRGEIVGYTAFASETDQSFVRDEIRGDGTSGLYRLSSAPIIGNSDEIRIEVRDRFDTGTVLSVQKLSRFLDYSIDILDGTLYFKRPIPNRDPEFNPVFIVAEYESYSDANEGIVAGGRGSVHFKNNSVEVGVTHINDGQEGSEADLTGLDLRWQINPETEFRAETAKSNRDDLGNSVSGTAHSAWIEHQGENVDVRAYIREIEEDYGLGVQNAAETGIRKVGIDGRAKFRENFYFDGEATWQQNLVTDTIRSTLRARLRYERGGFNGFAGLIHAQDAYDDGETLSSDLAEIGISQALGDVTLRATSNFAISKSADNVDFPTSYVLGADYKILPGVELFAEYENATGTDIDAQMTRVGVGASPWHRAQINTTLNNQSTEFGPRVFANIGLIQGFKLSDNWVLDLGVDSTKTIVDPGVRQFDPDRELVSGSFGEDFAAYYVGATYNADFWSANGRVEFRDSDSEDRLALLAGWYREPSMGHSMSAGAAVLNSKLISNDETNSAVLKYGWAWRKADSRWSFLNRIDLIIEELVLTDQTQKNNRLINNFNANRRMSESSQLSLQYAFKYVKGTFDGMEISGYTDLIGLDFRHGFNPRWDIGAHTSIYNSHQSGTSDYGFGLDVGFNLTDNMWVTLGYNLFGFHDDDFTQARWTAQGPFLRLTVRADQHSLKRISDNR